MSVESSTSVGHLLCVQCRKCHAASVGVRCACPLGVRATVLKGMKERR